LGDFPPKCVAVFESTQGKLLVKYKLFSVNYFNFHGNKVTAKY